MIEVVVTSRREPVRFGLKLTGELIQRLPAQQPQDHIHPRAQAAVATSSLNFSDGVIQPSVREDVR